MELILVAHPVQLVQIELMLQPQQVVPVFVKMDFIKMPQMLFALPAIIPV